MKYVHIIVWILGIVLMPHLLHAQVQSTDLSLTAIPSNPNPNQSVTISAKSFGADLTTATLVWSYNNAVVARGVGKTSISIAAPQAGSAGVVTVEVTGATIEPASESIVFRPASTDLLWEAIDAYTPPFYKGKALLPLGGMVRVTAIPSASTPQVLNYQWSRSNSALPSDSGSGKSSIVLEHDPLNGQEKIDVTTQNGSYTSSATLRINPYSPLLVTYVNKDGYIDYADGYLETIRMNKPGSLLHFEPYYFSVPIDLQRDLSTTISVNGETIATEQPNEFAVSRPETGTQSTFDLTVTTTDYTLQYLKKTFTLLFN